MKPFLYILIITALFGSCKKEQVNPEIIIEPPLSIIIQSDTLTTGQWWGLNIGDTIPNIYKTIQNIQTEKQIKHLGIVGNVFTKLEDIQSTITLYNSLLLNEKNGSASGIQVYFANNKVKSIWTNSGTELSRWPSNTDNAATIAKDDPIEHIYSRLTNIKRIDAFANKFERISLFDKDISKAYDAQMSKSPQWYFSATVSDKRFYVVELNFSSGILTSVYATLSENP